MIPLEIAYLLVAYGMAGVMFYTTRHTTFPTFSHIALSRTLNRHVFFWGLSVSAIIFAIMMYGWVLPSFGLDVWAGVVVGALVTCQILTGLFPVSEKSFGGPHAVFASGLGVCMFLLLVAFAASGEVNPVARGINGLLASGMILLAATSVRAPKSEYMLREKIFFGFWHIAVFVTVFFG